MNRRYSLLVAFWGDFFIDSFTTFCIPTLDYPGNLPWLATHEAVDVKIATTQSGYTRLIRSKNFQRFQKKYPVSVECFPDSIIAKFKIADSKYSVWATMLNALKQQAYQEKRNYIFAHPDSIYPDGFLKTLSRNAASGKKLIFTAGVRIDHNITSAYFKRNPQYLTADGPTLQRRKFDAFTINSGHRFIKHQYWKSNRLSNWPSALFFSLDENHTAARFFDMHPIYADCEAGRRLIKKNLDVDYDFDTFVELAENEGWLSVGTMEGENRYFASLTETNDAWTNRLVLVGDDHEAALKRTRYPRNDKEKFLHLQRWMNKFAPMKKILCFQDTFLFNHSSQTLTESGQRCLNEMNIFCDTILDHKLMHFDRTHRLPLSVSLEELNIHFTL